jgi:hypothetical protein
MRGEHRQHELDGVRQLNRNHGIGGQPGFDEMRRQRRDGTVRLREGQPLGWSAGNAGGIERIEQGQRLWLTCYVPSKQSLKRRRWRGLNHELTLLGHFNLAAGRCHHVSGRYPVNAVVLGRSIRFQRAIHCSLMLNRGIA